MPRATPHARRSPDCTRSLTSGLGLLTAACSLLVLAPLAAHADDTADVRLLRQQILALQSRLDAVEARATQATQAAQNAAQQSQTAAQSAAKVAAVAPSVPAVTDPNDSSITLGNGVKLTPGGFIAAESVYRTRNETADIDSNFNGSPLPNNANYNHGEFRESARQSRLSLLAEGNVDSDTKLSAYFEGDFLGAAVTANSNQSNSYTPRIRNIYTSVDWNDLGLHLLAGQNWSLLTTNTTGMLPRTEAPPPTIDAQYVVGFDWTRNPGLRLVKDWDSKYWLGVSLESPQTLNGFTGALGTNNTNTGGTLLNSSTTYTTDIAPDIIVKAAADTGFGHFELFDLTRFFQNRPIATALAAIPGVARQNDTAVGWGVGGSAVIPVVPKYVDFQANVMGGQGIGRYGTSNLPDVTVGANGQLEPLTEVTAMAGLNVHLTPSLTTYLFGGTERAEGQYSNVDGKALGYGNPLYSNAGCFTEGSAATCTANTKDINELTLGGWWKFYQGSFGTVQFGLQGVYFKRDTFAGVGGAPSPDETEIYTSFRYYPF